MTFSSSFPTGHYPHYVSMYCLFLSLCFYVLFISISVYSQSKGKVDRPMMFIAELNKPDLRGEKRMELIESLRVALTNNPVR